MAQTDRKALVAFYIATDGPSWKRKTNWDTDVDLSDWYGVTANDQGRVMRLVLFNNNLRGIYGLPTDNACCSLAMSLTFPKNFLTESDPFMKLQVLQEATMLSF